jgi:NADPH-dependent 2,4-dienoyl-CoA reductase/sulfur reductase-like enzyme
MAREATFDVLVVGAGPAGIAAACVAAEAGARVGLVDDNPAPGGQIWRGGPGKPADAAAAAWFARHDAARVERLDGVQVAALPAPGILLAEAAGEALLLRHAKLILAPGARERYVPFPGWTLPGVVGAGGIQALLKAGFPVAGKRVVVAGSGPLLLAVAAALRDHGAEVPVIAEQAPWGRLVRFGLGLVTRPGKLLQGAGYKWKTLGTRYAAGCWPVAAEGAKQVERAILRTTRDTWTEPCDLMACGFGFVGNLELPRLLGCAVRDGAVVVDAAQETSVPGVWCAGEPTGIGGVDQALLEGQVAGLDAAGRRADAERLAAARDRARRFGRALDRAFALREELKNLAADDTIVCRCEDVPRGRLAACGSWREAKLHTRCGMGPCQGRVCGGATHVLFGWTPESARPPVYPVPLGTLGSAPAGSPPAKGDTAAGA